MLQGSVGFQMLAVNFHL